MKTIEEEFPPVLTYVEPEDYKRLRARAAEMERALQDIAMQHLADEMDDHTSEHADWQLGYEMAVTIARKALPPAPEIHQTKP